MTEAGIWNVVKAHAALRLDGIGARRFLTAIVAFGVSCQVFAQNAELTAEERTNISTEVTRILQQSGAPSAVVGIVKNGRVAYTAAFGDAQISPRVPAAVNMPYGVGSVSKQFTAAAVMVLAEEGKLRLDEPAATWFPELAHSREVTLRQLLNQVSGYSDYYTEDYLTPELAVATDPYALVKRWTEKPLDFAPGTKWQYSNTNYVLSALIVQKASGEPFFRFLSEHVLRPAGLKGVVNLDGDDVPSLPKNYVQFAMGPARETPREGKGTLLGAGQLSMPIGQLALWDTVVLHRDKVLQPASWQILESEVSLPDGSRTRYGMGYFLQARDSRRILGHSGGLNGFTTLNNLYPDQDAAIAVMVNSDRATSEILHAVEQVLFAPKPVSTPVANIEATELVRKGLEQLQRGAIDRTLLSDNLGYFFTRLVLEDYKTGLSTLGTIQKIELLRNGNRGGMIGLLYRVMGTSGVPVTVSVYVTKDGKLDQLLLMKAQ